VELTEEINETDDYIAMVHLGASDEPLTTPALQAVDGDELSAVTDDATVTIGEDEEHPSWRVSGTVRRS